jgi:hypothetical protein
MMEMLVPRVKALKLGNGLDESVDVGPVVNEEQLKTMDYYVEVGKNEDKAQMLCGGARATGGDLDKGYFFQPTVFDGVTSQHAHCPRRDLWSCALSYYLLKVLKKPSMFLMTPTTASVPAFTPAM